MTGHHHHHPDIRPTVDEVAALIRARTKDAAGNELGTFTDQTRPTDEQVEEEINHGVTMLHSVVARVGANCADIAREAVRLTVAARIERAYWPEQTTSSESAYPRLVEEQQLALSGLAKCVAGELPGGDGGVRGFRVIDLQVWDDGGGGETVFVETDQGGDLLPWLAGEEAP